MKKQEKQKTKCQTLALSRETLHKLDDDALHSIAGGCNRMPYTCTCNPTY